MEPVMGWAKLILDTLRSPLKVMFVLVVLSACTLFLPADWLRKAGVYEFTQVPSHRVIAWAVLVGCGLYLAIEAAERLVQRGAKILAARQQHGKLVNLIGNLTQQERAFVRRFYFPESVAHIYAYPHEVGRLEHDGIVYCPGDSGFKTGEQTWCLTDEARGYISEHASDFLAELENTSEPHTAQ